jgi:hypothetical protein
MENETLENIERFIARTGMAESTFGRKAVSDWRLIRDLRNGRELRRNTLARVNAFMAEF